MQRAQLTPKPFRKNFNGEVFFRLKWVRKNLFYWSICKLRCAKKLAFEIFVL
jgi:hypothetical protein